MPELSSDARLAINEERERVVGIFIVWVRNFEKNLEERKRKGKEGEIMSGRGKSENNLKVASFK